MNDENRSFGRVVLKAIVILVVVVIVGFGLFLGMCGLMLR
jgi:hypothetical protein